MVSSVFNIPLSPVDLASRKPNEAPRFRALDRFIIGPENRLLDVITQNILLGQVTGNPLVLYGPGGAGKTRLARGLAGLWQQWQGQQRQDKNWVVEAKQFRRLSDRADKNSLLVIENVDRVSAAATGQRLCSAINQSIQIGQQLIITSKFIPASLARLSPGLRSRLVGGLVIGIAKPSGVVCQEIIGAQARALGITLTAGALKLLADNLEPNPGKLVAVVKEIAEGQKKARGGAHSVDAAWVKRCLAASSAQPPLARFAVVVARHCGTTVAQLRGRSRRRGIATARSVFMYLAHEQGHYSFLSIGNYLDGRDHTTVLHGCRSIQQQLLNDVAMQQEMIQLKEDLLDRG